MLRVGFVTCVKLGLSCMEAIYEAGGALDFAMTLRDDTARAKSGRVFIDGFCKERQIPLHKVRNINDTQAVQAICDAKLDWLFIVGWSQIAGPAVLGAARKGVLGMHPTLLPQGRGRAPIPWAILLNLPRTGVSLFKMDEGVDSGPIVAQHIVPMTDRETATTLYAKINTAHVELLRESWSALIADEILPTPQRHEDATTWVARRPEDGRLSSRMTVAEADRLIRAVTHPYPGAFLETTDGKLRVWSAAAPGVDLASSDFVTRRLTFCDGWLDATEFELETT